ncbi:MAG: rRNA ((966)-N(2))-methyltransferase [Myxococcaceae bacterium]|nr:rRNA ((966)-N(2))-methyltransferase [Myxococcaceae bacterium]
MGSIRIVGGALGGRRLRAPAGDGTRPTSERVREAMASVLSSRHAIQGARIVELYAGSGALGFEMLSRGAEHVVFVERDPRVAKLIRENATELGVSAQVEVLCEDVTRTRGQSAILQRAPYSLVLADPPYADVAAALEALSALRAHGMLASDACLLLEHGTRGAPVLPNEFNLISDYRYGDTAVVLFAENAALRRDHEGKER